MMPWCANVDYHANCSHGSDIHINGNLRLSRLILSLLQSHLTQEWMQTGHIRTAEKSQMFAGFFGLCERGFIERLLTLNFQKHNIFKHSRLSIEGLFSLETLWTADFFLPHCPMLWTVYLTVRDVKWTLACFGGWGNRDWCSYTTRLHADAPRQQC